MSGNRGRALGTAAAAAGLAGLLALTGCESAVADPGTGATTTATDRSTPAGGSAQELPSASALCARMRAALIVADSVTFRTTTSGATTQTVTFSGDRGGTNVRLVRDTDAETIEVRVIGGTAYLKGDRRYWESAGYAGRAGSLAGRWLRTPVGGVGSDGTDMTRVLDAAFAAQPTLDDLARGRVERTELDGTEAYLLTGFDGTDSSRLWIAAGDDAYPLRLTVGDPTATSPAPPAGQANSAEMVFSAWNAAPRTTAPPASQVSPLPRR